MKEIKKFLRWYFGITFSMILVVLSFISIGAFLTWDASLFVSAIPSWGAVRMLSLLTFFAAMYFTLVSD